MATEPVVVYVSAIRWPWANPSGPFTASYTASISRAGAPVHLIVQSPDRGFERYGLDGRAVFAGEYGITPPENLRVHVLRTPRWKPASDSLLFYQRAVLLVGKLRRRHGVNVVMSRDTRFLPFLARLKRRGMVAVHDSHNFYADLSERGESAGKRYRRHWKYESCHLPELSGLVALLETQAELYRRSFPTLPVTAAHPGLWHAAPPDPSRFDRKTVGYVGSLSDGKGMEEILKAFRKAGLDGWRLLFIGGRTSGEQERLTARAEKQRLSGAVSITGWLPLPKMHERMHELSLLVLPHRETFYNRFLTAPSKLLDSLSQAIPMIASDLPSLRELADDSALYVPAGDTEALASAMRKLALDRGRHDELAAAAHRRALELHWDRRGEATVAFLKRLLDGSID